MEKGKIVILKNNYGLIASVEGAPEDEWIPFEIKNTMLVKKDEKEYIRYTAEVEYTTIRIQGMRDRDIREAQDIKFIGNDWKYKERKIEDSYVQIVRNRLDEYNFFYPNLNDQDFLLWLKENGFQPRMLEYLSPGIFTCVGIIKQNISESIDFEDINSKFKIGLLFGIDRIDIELRKHILSWVTGIENAYKTYFSEIGISEDGDKIFDEIISEWASKKPKIRKLIKRARDKRKYRNISDEFNYLENETAVPFYDLMEQLELSELSELVREFYDIYSKKDSIPLVLQKMEKCINFINDLSTIRNAAAHGRPLLPAFMDPDYNGNWDLEFDNIEERSNVDKWILYGLLSKKWKDMELGDYTKQIVNTVYGNPMRRAWVELHFLYKYIISEIEKKTYDLYMAEAMSFLDPQPNQPANLLNLKLSDMKDTTLNFSPPPYNEIAREAFAVWEIFENAVNL